MSVAEKVDLILKIITAVLAAIGIGIWGYVVYRSYFGWKDK